MGLDAYAIDNDGNRLPTLPGVGSFVRQLIRAEQQFEFSKTARILVLLDGHVDADFFTGGLGISANASAANHLLYSLAGLSDESRYSPAQVLIAAQRIAAGDKIGLPGYIVEDPRALDTAKAFIKSCAKLGLGIQMSP